MTKKRKRAKVEEDAFSRILDEAGAETKKPNKAKKPGRKKKIALIAVIFACFFLLLFCGLGFAGYMVTGSGLNFPNVFIDGLDAGGLTKEQTAALLESHGWNEKVEGELEISIPGEVSFSLDRVTAGAEYTTQQAVDAAYAYGRGDNWFNNLFTYLKSYLSPVDVNRTEKPLNEDYIRAGMDRAIALMERAISGSGYELDREKSVLTMIKGAEEIELNEEAMYAAIAKALVLGEEQLEFSELAKPLSPPDFDKLYAQLAVEPADARFDENFEIIPEVIGCSFDVASAKKLWDAAAPGEKIEIPLSITTPEMDSEALRAMLFRDRLGSQTTYYTWSSANRINNIHLAAEKINGLVLLPGESFSFNETVGQRTEEAGFKMAGAYNDGQVVEAVGGGICQVSSTLYCAQMFAQLKTTNRVNHYFKVDYLDYGLDATVSWKSPDYKFTNSRDYPVKIVAYCEDESSALTIDIWGTDLDGSYVQIRHTSEPVYDETWTDTLIGYTVRSYRDVYDANGNWLDTVKEPGGVYYFHDEDIAWPPEKEEAEKDMLESALDTLEKLEKENAQQAGGTEGGYLFDPDEFTGGIDIYA